eukprot:15451325-Alexandrium_andersonii.AAC.1
MDESKWTKALSAPSAALCAFSALSAASCASSPGVLPPPRTPPKRASGAMVPEALFGGVRG